MTKTLKDALAKAFLNPKYDSCQPPWVFRMGPIPCLLIFDRISSAVDGETLQKIIQKGFKTF